MRCGYTSATPGTSSRAKQKIRAGVSSRQARGDQVDVLIVDRPRAADTRLTRIWLIVLVEFGYQTVVTDSTSERPAPHQAAEEVSCGLSDLLSLLSSCCLLPHGQQRRR